ncbi:MAG: PQQ-binding-like beta-propeller repeat protein [Treponema sp.]|jgi:outer membrane protein assembly factor BamB|nr:PQQ-binding-like beta-propeller repeat protein [Treponema sp.]
MYTHKAKFYEKRTITANRHVLDRPCALLRNQRRFGFFLVLLLFPWTIYSQTLGKAVWKQPIGGEVIGLPSVQAGSVVVLSESGSVKAYSRQGNALWNYEIEGKFSPYITRSREGTNYICKTNGVFIALNRIGRELWRIDLGDPLTGPVLIGWDGRLFVPTDRKISCYTTAGNLLWYKLLERPIAVSPCPDRQGGFIMALDNGEVLQINEFGNVQTTRLPETPALMVSLAEPPAQEAPKYEKDRESKKTSIPILVLYKNGSAEIIGDNTQDYPSLPPLPSQPIGAANRNGKTAIVLKNGEVLLLSAEEGRILWKSRSGITPVESGEDGNQAALIYDERGVYMLSKAGAAGFTEQGQRLWFIRIIGATAVPIFSDEGMLYSGGNDWNLYAYRLEARSLPVSQGQSLYGPLPEGTYYLGRPFPSQKDYTNQFSERELNNQFIRINKALEEGQVGEQEKEFIVYLMEVAASLRNSIRVSMARPPVHFNQRIEAIRLLSCLGSQEIIPFLVDLFSNEPDPLVKAAAAEAIGRIGVDPEGLALTAFSLGVLSPGRIKDEPVLVAIAVAVGGLCRFSGPPVMGTGASILIALAGSDKPVRVRNRALLEIRSLRQ